MSKQLEPIAELLTEYPTDFPLEILAPNQPDFIELMSEAPAKISASFISIDYRNYRNYDKRGAVLLFGIGTPSEMYDNYFPDIEESAQQFSQTFEISEITSPNDNLYCYCSW